MRTFLIAVILTLNSAWALTTGEKIPASELKTAMKNVDGKTVTLEQISKGKKATLVVFTCNACPFAKAWWSRMEKIGNDYMAKGIGVVAINSNDASANDEEDFAHMVKQAKGLKFPYVVDATSQVAKSFGASKTPEVYLFNSKGELAYQGAIDSDAHNEKNAKAWLKQSLNDVLAGKKVAEAEHKALGCGIKFHSVN
jgi:peroxiredoxin